MDSFTSPKTHGGGEVMFRILIYVLAGGVGVFYVLPKIASLIANLIHRYIHSASLDVGPKVGQRALGYYDKRLVRHLDQKRSQELSTI